MKKIIKIAAAVAVVMVLSFTLIACNGGEKKYVNEYGTYYLIKGKNYELYFAAGSGSPYKAYSGNVSIDGNSITFMPKEDYFTYEQIRGGFVVLSYEKYTGTLADGVLTIGNTVYYQE